MKRLALRHILPEEQEMEMVQITETQAAPLISKLKNKKRKWKPHKIAAEKVSIRCNRSLDMWEITGVNGGVYRKEGAVLTNVKFNSTYKSFGGCGRGGEYIGVAVGQLVTEGTYDYLEKTHGKGVERERIGFDPDDGFFFCKATRNKVDGVKTLILMKGCKSRYIS